MREIHLQQPTLTATPIEHSHCRELRKMSEILDAVPEATEFVHRDLVAGLRRPEKGRRGLSAEQLLRALVLKQMNGFSYDELAFHLADSRSYRWFCRLGIDGVTPTRTALQKACKRVSPETWQALNQTLVQHATALKIESGDKTRTDSTVVETHIHHPTDSSLLWDCVRVLCRLMKQAKKDYGIRYEDRKRRAKRRAREISNAKNAQARKAAYRDLIGVADDVVEQARVTAEKLQNVSPNSILDAAKLGGLMHELEHFMPLAHRVISQAERRVLRGETVAASEKIVSIFEPHTDIIIKDNRETQYGHKLCLTTGASGIVTHAIVERGNPSDRSMAVKMIDAHIELYGHAPRQACFDGGFSSRANLNELKARGVEDVAFAKRGVMTIEEMVKSTWVYQRLRNFRAGVEGIISFLKRSFGLSRCRWSGFDSFLAYVQASVVSCNLLLLSRHLLARTT
jgi:transposase, IS5 family